MSVSVVALIIANWFKEVEVLPRVPTVAELADPDKMIHFRKDTEKGIEQAKHLEVKVNIKREGPCMLVRHFLNRQGHKGGEVKLEGGPTGFKSSVTQAIDPGMWRWR